jgi:hypothetical protein
MIWTVINYAHRDLAVMTQDKRWDDDAAHPLVYGPQDMPALRALSVVDDISTIASASNEPIEPQKLAFLRYTLYIPVIVYSATQCFIPAETIRVILKGPEPSQELAAELAAHANLPSSAVLIIFGQSIEVTGILIASPTGIFSADRAIVHSNSSRYLHGAVLLSRDGKKGLDDEVLWLICKGTPGHYVYGSMLARRTISGSLGALASVLGSMIGSANMPTTALDWKDN